MGKRGPAPQPTKLRVLKGNPGKRAINKDEPQPQVGVGDPPEFLDDLAVAHWQELAPMLERLGVLTEADRPTFVMLCQAWSAWRAAIAEADGKPAIFVAKSGYTQVTGYVSLARQRLQDYKQLAAKFGLTPSDRTSIKVADPTTNLYDPLGLLK